MRRILRFPRWLVRIALVVYFALGLAWLGLRYIVLPQADQWRGALAQQLSQALGAQVELGAVSADWWGWSPRLRLRDIVIQNTARAERLELPYLHVTPSWRSVLSRRLEFSRLEVAGLDITVHRDGAGRVSILDQTLGQAPAHRPAQSASPRALPATLQWLLAQPWVDVRDVTVRWVDVARGAPPLVLQHVQLQIRQHGREHQFALTLSPPSALARTIDLRAQVQLPQGAPLDWSSVRARVYARADGVQPGAWQPWLDLPAAWQDGALDLQASATVQDGALGVVALNLETQQGQWQWHGARLAVQAARAFVEGSPATLWPGIGAATAHAPPLRVNLKAAGVEVHTPEYFDDPLQFDQFAVAGQVEQQADGTPRVVLDAVHAVNTDLDVTWQGQWRAAPATEAGMIDWHGRFQRLDARAIVRYLPKEVSSDARAWLRVGILGGDMQNADFSLQGDVAHFPFGDAPDAGDFTFSARLTDGVIDYAANAHSTLPWPRLDDIQGSLEMRRVALTLHAEHATMTPGAGLEPLVLSNLRATIPNIERDAHLTVQGHARAPAQSFLGFLRNSPLGARLDHVFEQASGSGQWLVPLTLVVPLLHSLDLTVDGTVQFDNAQVQLMPEMPPFTALNGTLAFTHTAIRAPDLNGQFLGGALAIRGGIGSSPVSGQDTAQTSQLQGLQFSGTLKAEALRAAVGVEGMRRVKGQTGYTAVLQRDPARGFDLHIQSDLRGLALDLPAPLGKSADAAVPLDVRWGRATGARNRTVRAQALDVALARDARLRLLHRPGDAPDAPYFYGGALTLRQTMPAAIPPGLRVDVDADRVDALAWQQLIAQFAQAPKTRAARARPLWPDLTDLRVRAENLNLWGVQLHDATLSALRTEGQDWRLALVSAETKGMVLWHAARGAGADKVQAQFDRLALTLPAAPRASTSLLPDAFTLPDLDVEVGDLALDGYRLGEVTLKGAARADDWQLASLRIAATGLRVQGQGVWKLRGAGRGLQLDAQANITDLGAYLTQMGVADVVHAGQGSVQATFFWADLPWRPDIARVQGTLRVALQAGRFSRVNSRAARMLELLSIQSLQRLAQLDWNLDGLAREGYPFDVLQGELRLHNAQLHTQDLRVTGPVGTIAVSGSTHLQTQHQDVRALVVPNLDISGAALAAGFVINPVVGAGALLTQWLLKGSVQDAMAVEYRVQGTWDEPDIEAVARNKE